MIRIPSRTLICAASLLLLIEATASSAAAGDLLGIREEAFDDPSYEFTIDTEVSAGMLSGTSHELVYETSMGGRKVSELIWTMDDVAIIGGKLSIKPSHWWSVDLAGHINATHEATMDDYDWLDPTRSDWTHWSHHPDTSLERALMIDLSTKLALWRTSYFDLQAIAGYRWDKFEWNAYGGSYVYSDLGFRDDVGNFSAGDLGISYKQEFQTPYVGLGGHLKLGDFSAQASVLGSWWATADSLDIHYMRFLEFQDDFGGSDGEMLRYEAEGRYQLTESLALKAGWQHLEYDEMKGPTRISIATGGPGLAYYPGDAAGTDHESDIISAGVVYSFH